MTLRNIIMVGMLGIGGQSFGSDPNTQLSTLGLHRFLRNDVLAGLVQDEQWLAYFPQVRIGHPIPQPVQALTVEQFRPSDACKPSTDLEFSRACRNRHNRFNISGKTAQELWQEFESTCMSYRN